MKLNPAVKNIALTHNIFEVSADNFTSMALEVFLYQYQNNPVYHQYCDTLNIDCSKIDHLCKIPFLPISFFKTHPVTTTAFVPALVFESSGTTQTVNSKHLIKDPGIYEESFSRTFRKFYDDPSEYCIIALLPSYLERNNSSLVLMADNLIRQSAHPLSGFYLNEFKQLQTTLEKLEALSQKTLLIGVTFALLDFATFSPMPLYSTTIMETGGMKGRRKEMIRQEVHEILCKSFRLKNIHSEYGMTELLSQAYSSGEGIFSCPPWMKIVIREEDDPLTVNISTGNGALSGAINVIDLANIYSCSFIATEDAGKLHADGRFEIAGRIDNTDVRGCSLLAL